MKLTNVISFVVDAKVFLLKKKIILRLEDRIRDLVMNNQELSLLFHDSIIENIYCFIFK